MSLTRSQYVSRPKKNQAFQPSGQKVRTTRVFRKGVAPVEQASIMSRDRTQGHLLNALDPFRRIGDLDHPDG